MDSDTTPFSGYLAGKKIDPEAFRLGLPYLWEKWNSDFSATSQASFDHQVKFLLNNLRLEFPLPETSAEPTEKKQIPVSRPKPVMRRPAAQGNSGPPPETT